ncbi:TrmH family RNA methyltransferase [Polynucleobacter rarus]|uniref:TrmH family RNA methyltransferase n=1 Tax=Polynucleobacter rarus TaxID=556055 RepID=UPI000D3EC8CB|nr:RNA methyltransferase [Polynucleobacter rarus]
MSYDLYSFFKEIQSKSNDSVKELIIHQEGGSKANKLRKESGLALIEGIHLLDSWMKSNQLNQIEAIFTTAKGLEQPEISALLVRVIDYFQDAGLRFPELVMLDESLQKLVSFMPEAPLLQCLIKIPTTVTIDYGADLVILDAIQDAGNVGTILRTCAAAGFEQVICIKGTAAVWSNKVLRAGMGAQASLKMIEGITPYQLLSDLEIPLLCSQLDEAKSLYEIADKLEKPVAWVFGNEGQGICSELRQDGLGVKIPQVETVESLNVSAAAAIALFETRRVRLKSLH